MSDQAPFTQLVDGAAAVQFQASVYGLQSILKATHRFSNTCFVHIEQDASKGTVTVQLRGKRSLDNVAAIAGELSNAVLEQSLRDRLSEETEPIRRVLIAQAFSNTSLLHPELDTADPTLDPLAIGKPDRV